MTTDQRSPESDDNGADIIARLFAEHGGAVLGYATRLTGDRYLAEDVVQEAMIRAWRHRDNVQPQPAVQRAWLLTVVRRIVIDQARARAARPALVSSPVTDDRVEHNAARFRGRRGDEGPDFVSQIADAQFLDSLLSRLSPAHREVIVEVYYRGRTVTEVADELGIAVGTAKSRCFYALRAVRDMIQGQGCEVDLRPELVQTQRVLTPETAPRTRVAAVGTPQPAEC
ncbi:sigma-70 family RNA polymerase sigma factor [Angustibacter sp. McL0619]|uniref:sigma-70 family RNA polymerase sigma factor n=1 Tax=Angustibacter sp. McL0619 TaxID=3415676 RepID=UPI003CFB3B9C